VKSLVRNKSANRRLSLVKRPMRVITGLYKGRRLKTLEGMRVRPTSDRLRETLFNVLAPRIEGARFADLCAGSGAVGIEALSRGADQVFFVESSRKAAAVISENLRHCGVKEGARVVNRDVLTALKYFAQHEMQFDICYFDPPYDSEIYSPVLWLLAKSNLLAADGRVIVEHRRQLPLAPNYDDLRPYREIIQGESCLTFYEKMKDEERAGEREKEHFEERTTD
jgi:16S rRNA (guanine(966)-N(2))-methyltransferase RsmD